MVGDVRGVVEVPDGDVAGTVKEVGRQEQVVDGGMLGAPVVLPVLGCVIPPGRVTLLGGEGASYLVQRSLRCDPGSLPRVASQNGKDAGRRLVPVSVGHAVAKVVQIPQEDNLLSKSYFALFVSPESTLFLFPIRFIILNEFMMF